jgi:adenylate cyclase
MATDEHELQVSREEPAERLSRLRAAAVRIDTQLALLEAARRLRRRLPGDEKFGDPLSTAGPDPVHLVARGVSALRPERESLTQELSLAGLQLWQSPSEAAGRGRGGTELALMFTDLVGFSTWALKAGDGPVLELLRMVGSAEEAAIEDHRGQIVKRLGDGVMATFLTVQDGVEAALDVHAALDELDVDGYRPRMRAGIHWGRPRRLGGESRSGSSAQVARLHGVEGAAGVLCFYGEGPSWAEDLPGRAARSGDKASAAGLGDGRRLHRSIASPSAVSKGSLNCFSPAARSPRVR